MRSPWSGRPDTNRETGGYGGIVTRVTTALLRNRETGQAIRALGCDPKRAHGRVFGLALLDEPAQWPRGSRDAMLSAIDTGAGKVEGSRIVALGTRPAGAHWFADWLDGGADFAQCHAARPGDPPFQLADDTAGESELDPSRPAPC